MNNDKLDIFALERRRQERARGFSPVPRPALELERPGEFEADIAKTLACARARSAAIEQAWDAEVAAARSSGTLARCQSHSCELPLDRARSLEQTAILEQHVVEYLPCPVCLGEARELRARARLRQSGVGEAHLSCTLDNWKPQTPEDHAALEKIRSYVARPRGGLVIIGKTPGTGKTHLAVAAMKAIGRAGTFGTWRELMAIVRTSYSTGRTEHVIERFASCPMLVIDDIGVMAGGADEPAVLYDVANARYKRVLPFILTGNFARTDDMKSLLGERVHSRLTQCVAATVILGGPDRRKEYREQYFSLAGGG